MLLTLSYWPNQGRNWRASRTEFIPQLTDEQWLLISEFVSCKEDEKVAGVPRPTAPPCLEGVPSGC